MRTKKAGLMVAATTALLLLAGACSSSDDTTTTGGGSSTTAGSSSGTVAEGPVGTTDATETPAAEIEKMVGEASLITDGTLTICSDIPYAPFEFEENGELTGFDVNLVDAMAEEMNLQTEFKTTPFDSIIPALVSESCDLIVSATTITPARSEQVLFTDPYFDADQSLMVSADNKDTYKTLDDLGGKTIGVQAGTTGADYADENKPEGATIKEYPGASDLFLAIAAGEIDAVLQDFPVNAYHALQNDQFTVTETIPTGEQYGMAANLTNTNLVDALNAALGNVQVSGDYDSIYESWFGAS